MFFQRHTQHILFTVTWRWNNIIYDIIIIIIIIQLAIHGWGRIIYVPMKVIETGIETRLFIAWRRSAKCLHSCRTFDKRAARDL